MAAAVVGFVAVWLVALLGEGGCPGGVRVLRRLLVVVVLAGLLGSGSLVVPPVLAGAPGLAMADGTSDVTEAPSVPLPHLALPADPADAIVGLPYELDTIPDDASGAAAVDGDWSQVPGLPVEVHVDADPQTGAADPTEGPTDAAVPSETASPSPTESPSPRRRSPSLRQPRLRQRDRRHLRRS